MSVQLSRSENVAQATALRAERARRRGTYPLSYAQLRLWLLDQSDPGSPVYNVSRAFRLEGALDVAALERAIDAIVARHAPLRTTFHFVDGHPVQVVQAAAPVALQLVDLRALSPQARRARTERTMAEAGDYRFRLSVDAMLRTTVLRLAADEHILIMTIHHIAVDERSLEILYAELRANYAAFSAGHSLARPPLPMQYTEFAMWERARSAGDGMRAQLAYWKTQLAAAPPKIALPYARPRPGRSRFSGASSSLSLTHEQIAALAAVARDAGATPFMTYLAAFYALLHQYSGARDLVVGSAISGRRRHEAEDIIGFFGNAVALRLDLSGDPSFGELVRRVKAMTLDAFANCEAPFEHVVASVAKERSATANPVFQVMFAMQPPADAGFALAGIVVTALEAPRKVAKFDLTALVFEHATAVDIELNYDTGALDEATIATMLSSFGAIFDTIAAAPQARLSTLCPKPKIAARSEPLEPLATVRAAADGGDLSERRALEAQLREVWETLLDLRPIGLQDDFFAIGGHSLLAVRLIERIEVEYGIRLPLATLFEEPTIEHVARALISRAPAPSLTPLRPIRRGSLQPPVVFFHGDMSGGSFYLRTVLKYLGDRTVYALPPHGVDGGDVPETIEAMAADRLDLLRREGVHPPYDLVGYCNGALVALEVGRLLAASGAPPPRIFAIEAEIYRPSVRRTAAFVRTFGTPFGLDERAQNVLVLRLLFRWNRIVRARGPVELALFAAAQLRSIATKLLHRTIAPGVAPVPERNLLEIYRERFLRYRPGPYAGRLTVLTARDERSAGNDRTIGWARVSPNAEFHLVAGDHASSITTQGVALAEQLRKCLDD